MTAKFSILLRVKVLKNSENLILKALRLKVRLIKLILQTTNI